MSATKDSVPAWLADAISWRALLRHFELSQGFSFVVVLVPSEFMADNCRVALEMELAAQAKGLQVVSIRDTRDLEQLAGKLLSDALSVVPGVACIWVARVVSQDASDCQFSYIVRLYENLITETGFFPIS